MPVKGAVETKCGETVLLEDDGSRYLCTLARGHEGWHHWEPEDADPEWVEFVNAEGGLRNCWL